MNGPAGFGRFVALDERDDPRLLERMSKHDLPVDGERYGVVSRLIARPGVSAVDLAASVLRKLENESGSRMSEWGGLVLSSRMVDVEGAARGTAERLQLQSPSLGVERACSGFPAATEIAWGLCVERQRPVAIATVEIVSDQINWEAAGGDLADQRRARGQASKLFADGAAAVLVMPGEAAGRHAILDAWVDEVPDEHQLIQKLDVENAWDPWGKVRPGPTTCISMPGRRGFVLFKRAPRLMADAVERSLRRVNCPRTALSHVVPHQANGLIMEALEKELAERSSPCRVWNCFRDCGNTVSASIPLAMAEVQDELPAGHLVAMPSVGAGGPGYRPDVLSVGCVVIRSGDRSADRGRIGV
jgi:3-oxoacyl-[acyl-carrier-protein] synthase-3